MCTKEQVATEVKSALEENNKVRDVNLSLKLSEQNATLVAHINDVIGKIGDDRTGKIDKVQDLCRQRGEGIATMNEQIKNIDSKVDTILKRMDENSKTYASKWVERAMVTIITIVCTSVLIALLSYVIIENK